MIYLCTPPTLRCWRGGQREWWEGRSAKRQKKQRRGDRQGKDRGTAFSCPRKGACACPGALCVSYLFPCIWNDEHECMLVLVCVVSSRETLCQYHCALRVHFLRTQPVTPTATEMANERKVPPSSTKLGPDVSIPQGSLFRSTTSVKNTGSLTV